MLDGAIVQMWRDAHSDLTIFTDTPLPEEIQDEVERIIDLVEARRRAERAAEPAGPEWQSRKPKP